MSLSETSGSSSHVHSHSLCSQQAVHIPKQAEANKTIASHPLQDLKQVSCSVKAFWIALMRAVVPVSMPGNVNVILSPSTRKLSSRQQCKMCHTSNSSTCIPQGFDPVLQQWQALSTALATCTARELVSNDALQCALAAWRATQAAVGPSESLSYAQAVAEILRRQASAPGWVKVNFPMGLLLAVMLRKVRWAIYGIYSYAFIHSLGNDQFCMWCEYA